MANRSPNIGLASGLRRNYSNFMNKPYNVLNHNPNAREAYEEGDIALDEANENERWNQFVGNYNPDLIPRFPSNYTFSNNLDGPGMSLSDRSNAEDMFTSNRQPTNNTDPVSAESGHNAFSDLMTTRGEGDPRSNERYQQLLARRDDIVAEIHRLMSEISWQETLKARNLTQDPLWEEAKYNWIYKGDDSGMKNIRDIEVKRKSDEEQRYWQAQENRKQRESTENLAKESKEASDDARLRDLEDQYDLLKQIYYVAKEESENAPDDVKLQRELKRAELNLRHAARKAKKTDELKEILNMEASPVSTTSPSPSGGTSGDKGAYLKNFGGTVVGWQINFDNAKGANAKLKLLNDALNAGFTEQELGVAGEKARLEKIVADDSNNKKKWESEQEKWYNTLKNLTADRFRDMRMMYPEVDKFFLFKMVDNKPVLTKKKYGSK